MEGISKTHKGPTFSKTVVKASDFTIVLQSSRVKFLFKKPIPHKTLDTFSL